MMSKIDMSLAFEGKQNLPECQQIEDPYIQQISKEVSPLREVQRERYLPSEQLIEAVNLAISLGRPLLLQGEPGCGKTRLAHAVAYELKLPIEESYIKSTSRAQELLYTYDAINRLYDAQLGSETPTDEFNVPLSKNIRNYIQLGPLGRAIARAQNNRRSVVLIDEIDKADLDFPNDLLFELDRLEFRVTESPDIHYSVPKNMPELRPIVIITHNEEKMLPTAFLRRCIFHYVEFPENEDFLQRILDVHETLDKKLSAKAISILLKLRQLKLNKYPGLSELIDWVGYLEAVETPLSDLEKIPYSGVLLKQYIDQQRAKEAFK